MIQKLKRNLSPKKIFSLLGLVSLVVFAQVSSVDAQTVTQGYASDETIQRATVVSLVQDDPLFVEPATFDIILLV
jgi:hypothetical protein